MAEPAAAPSKRAPRKRPAQPRAKRQRSGGSTARMNMLSSVLMARHANSGSGAATEAAESAAAAPPHRQSVEESLQQQIEDEERVETTYLGAEADRPPPLLLTPPLPDREQEPLSEQEKRRRAALALTTEDRRFSTWIHPCLETGLANTCEQIRLVNEGIDEACNSIQQLYQSAVSDGDDESAREANQQRCRDARMRMRRIAKALTQISAQVATVTQNQRSLMLSHDTMMRNVLCHANRVGAFNPERPGGKLISNPYMWK